MRKLFNLILAGFSAAALIGPGTPSGVLLSAWVEVIA